MPDYADMEPFYTFRLVHPFAVTPDHPANTGGTFVTHGVKFHNNIAVIIWLSDVPSVVMHVNTDNIKKIHCAHGETLLIYARSQLDALAQIKAGLFDAEIDALPPPRRTLAIQNLVHNNIITPLVQFHLDNPQALLT